MPTTLDVAHCPFCFGVNIQPYRIISGVQWYVCLDCGSKFRNPIIIPDKAESV